MHSPVCSSCEARQSDILTDVNDLQQSLEDSTEEADEKGEMKASTIFIGEAHFTHTDG